MDGLIPGVVLAVGGLGHQLIVDALVTGDLAGGQVVGEVFLAVQGVAGPVDADRAGGQHGILGKAEESIGRGSPVNDRDGG